MNANEPSKEAMDVAEELNQLLFPCSFHDKIHESNRKGFALIIDKHFQEEREEVREVLEKSQTLPKLQQELSAAKAEVERLKSEVSILDEDTVEDAEAIVQLQSKLTTTQQALEKAKAGLEKAIVSYRRIHGQTVNDLVMMETPYDEALIAINEALKKK